MTDAAVRHVSLSGIQQAFIIGWAAIALAVLAGAIWTFVNIMKSEDDSCLAGCGFSLLVGLVALFELWTWQTIAYLIGISKTGF